MKTQIIQLDSFDDVNSVKDKMNWSQTSRILLVFPQRGKVLKERLDLFLLLRYSESLGRQIAIVTDNPFTRTNAVDLGIPVFDQIQAAQATIWRKPKALVSRIPFTSQIRQRKNNPSTRQLKTAFQDNHSPNRTIWNNRVVRLVIFSIGVLSLLVIIAFLLPSAEIKITSPVIIQKAVVDISASPEIRETNLTGLVPSRWITITVEGRFQIPTTGSVNIPHKPAKGEAIFENITDKPVTIPENTIVNTGGDAPIRFQTTMSGTVSQLHDKITLPIIALEPGTTGNVSAGEIKAIEGTLGLNLIATNETPCTGGSSISVAAPSEHDRKVLYRKLTKTLQKTAEDELKIKSGQGFVILSEHPVFRKDAEVQYTPADNAPSDFLDLSLRQTYAALIANQHDIHQLASAILMANIPEGFSVIPGTLTITQVTQPEQTATSGKAYHWKIRGSQKLRRQIDTVRLTKMILGVPVDEAKQKLKTILHQDKSLRITIFPSWWARIPFIPFRISYIVINS